jgi:hypothetical protein
VMEPDLSSRAMIYFRELTALCLVLALASLSAGCSFSYSSDSSSDSSKSSSDSSNNSSESSSGSSFDDEDDDKDDDDGASVDTSYRDDVSDYMVAAYVAGLKSAENSSAAAAGAAAAGAPAASVPADVADAPGMDVAAFRKGLSGIAAKYGIVGWESAEVTYTGIGIGLAKAGLPQQDLATYSQALTDQDEAKAAAIDRGYGQKS